MSPATKVLDAYAILAFLEDQPGADAVKQLIERAIEDRTKLAMSVVNLGEVWYVLARVVSPEFADQMVSDIQGMAIEVVDADWAQTRQAAAFKSGLKLSYADCYTAALAKLRKGEIVTGDREFRSVEGEVKIAWL
jgi:ribonuclease VapC